MCKVTSYKLTKLLSLALNTDRFWLLRSAAFRQPLLCKRRNKLNFCLLVLDSLCALSFSPSCFSLKSSNSSKSTNGTNLQLQPEIILVKWRFLLKCTKTSLPILRMFLQIVLEEKL